MATTKETPVFETLSPKIDVEFFESLKKDVYFTSWICSIAKKGQLDIKRKRLLAYVTCFAKNLYLLKPDRLQIGMEQYFRLLYGIVDEFGQEDILEAQMFGMPRVKEVKEAVQEVVNETMGKHGLAAFMEEWRHLPSKMTEIGAKISSHADAVSEVAKSIQTTGQQIAQGFGTMVMDAISKIVSLISGVLALAMAKSAAQAALILTMLSCTFGVPEKVFSWIRDFISMDATRLMAQTDEKTEVAETLFGCIVGALKGVFKSQTEKEVKLSNARVDRITKSLVLLKNLKTIGQFFQEIVIEAINWFFEKMDWFPLWEDSQKIVYREILDWMRRVAILDERTMEKDIKDVHYRKNVFRLMEEMKHLGIKANAVKLEMPKYSRFESLKKHLELFYQQCIVYDKNDTGRKRPVCIEIIGKPGKGKTVLTSILCNDMMRVQGREFTAAEIFHYKPDMEFFENYNHQFMCLMDDYTQSMDNDERRKAVLNVIYMNNDGAYPLNMAKADLKGTAFFDSQALVLTSNRKAGQDPFSSVIEDVQALWRRIDFCIEIDSEPPTKQQIESEGGVCRSHYRITQRDPQTGAKIAVMDYPTFFTKVMKRYLEIQAGKESMIDMLKACAIPEYLKEAFEVAKKEVLKAQMMDDPFYVTVEEDNYESCDEFDPNFFKPQVQNEKLDPKDAVRKFSKLEDIDPETVELEQMLEREITKALSEESTQPMMILKNQEEVKAVFNLVTGELKVEDVSLKVRILEKLKNWKVKEKFTAVKDKMDQLALEFITTAKSYVDSADWRSYAKKVLAVIGVIGLTVGGVSYLFGKKTTEEEVEMDDLVADSIFGRQVQEKGRRVGGSMRTRVTRAQHHRLKVAMRAQELNENKQAVSKVVMKNIVGLRVANSKCAATMLNEQLFITVKHFWQHVVALEEKFTIFTQDGKDISYSYQEVDVVEDADRDVAFIFLPKRIEGIKDITPYFGNNSLDPRVAVCDGVAIILPGQQLVGNLNVQLRDTVEYHLRGENLCSDECFIIDQGGRDGWCGLPYISMNAKVERPVIGIHIAGNSFRSCGTFVTREMIQDAYDALGMEAQMDETLPAFDIDFLRELKHVKNIHVVPPQQATRSAKQSEIKPTILKGYQQDLAAEVGLDFKFSKTPAQLAVKAYKDEDGKRVLISPMREGLKKKLVREKIEDYVDEDGLYKMAADVFLEEMPRLHEIRTLTFEEGLNASKQFSEMQPLELSTSNGYPYNIQKHNLKGKRDYLVRDDKDIIHATKEYQEECERIWNSLVRGHDDKVPCIIADCLKDELLPFAKVYDVNNGRPIGKTRIMGPAPGPYLIAERRLFGSFYSNIIRWRQFGGPVDLGINPQSRAWDEMYQKFFRMVPKEDLAMIAGDVSAMDASETVFLFRVFEYVVCKYYGDAWNDDDKKRAVNLLRMLGENVKHIAANVMYETSGNPSGRFLTTIVNSVILAIILMVAAARKNLGKREPREVMKEVLSYMRVFGDDHICPIDKRDPLFDMFDVSNEFARHGMVYTSIFKDQQLEAYYDWDKCKYLQRTPCEVGGQIMGRLDIDNILESTCWGGGKIPPAEQCVATCSSAVIELAMHGRKYFEHFRTKWIELIKKHYPGTRCDFKTYEECWRMFRQLETYSDQATVRF